MATIRGYDWGSRSPRWAGIRSDVVGVRGIAVHLLRCEPGPAAPSDAPTQLLVHPMGAGAWSWLDVMVPLAAFGPVVAVDLPGSGRTKPARREASRVESSAHFLVDFVTTLGLGRSVVHGHSLGGMVAVLFAEAAPERVERLILTSAPLPGSIDPQFDTRAYQRIGSLLATVAPPILRLPMQAGLRIKAAAWKRWAEDPTDTRLFEGFGRIGTDLSKVSPELLAVVADEIRRYLLPWRVDGAVNAAVSVVAALTIGQRATLAAIDRIAAPTLLVWGDHDRVIPRELIDDLIARRPDWDLRTLEGVGHMPPWEAPEAYCRAVADWHQAGHRTP